MESKIFSLVLNVTLCIVTSILNFLLNRGICAHVKLVSYRSFYSPFPSLLPCIKLYVGMRAKFDSLSQKVDAVLSGSDG
jgi:hypothetical protein